MSNESIIEKMIKNVEQIVRINLTDQFDNKQGSITKTITKEIIKELDKVMNNED